MHRYSTNAVLWSSTIGLGTGLAIGLATGNPFAGIAVAVGTGLIFVRLLNR